MPLFYALGLGDLLVTEADLESFRIAFQMGVDTSVVVSELTYEASALDRIAGSQRLCDIDLLNSFSLTVTGSYAPDLDTPCAPQPTAASEGAAGAGETPFHWHCEGSTQHFTELAAIEAEIAVHPGSDPNPVNPTSQGKVPVALLGTALFDVDEVDLGSLAFGPAGAAPAHRALGHADDVNGDGLPDLVSHYRTQETGITMGDTQACVRGILLDGTPFEGCDAIRTTP